MLISTKGGTNGRIYDYRTNCVLQQTKANWSLIGKVAWADASGAFTGGMKGFEIGGTFGPHSAVIGAGLGGLLVGTISSLQKYSSCVETSCKAGIGIITVKSQDLLGAYQAITPNEINAEQERINTGVEFPVKYKDVYKTGLLHNILITKCIEGSILPDDSNIKESDEQMLKILENSDFQKIYDNACSGRNDIFLKDKSFPLTYMQVANLFMEAFILYPDSFEDVDYVINNYISTIESFNELSNIEKEMLYAAFGIAASSVRYWNML